MPRAAVRTGEAVGVRVQAQAAFGGNGRAFGVGDARIDAACGGLAAHGKLDGGLGVQPGPGVIEVQFRQRVRHARGVGEPRVRVRLGELRNCAGGLDHGIDGGAIECRARGVRLALAEIDRHADRLVALMFDGLDLAQTCGDGEPRVQRHVDFRRARAAFARAIEHLCRHALEHIAAREYVIGLFGTRHDGSHAAVPPTVRPSMRRVG